MAKILVYEMYPISWEQACVENSHANALQMMTEHLKRVKELSVDYVWLAPIYPSPRWDHGYDIAEYCSVDDRFGSLSDLDDFITAAHDHGLKVLMDLVLNHTSVMHEWFDPCHEHGVHAHPEYYCWSSKDRKDWHNLFDGGPAWKKDKKRKQYYLHLFHQYQPDLNWFPDGGLSIQLVHEFHRIIEFWTIVHDVDGFRIDVPQAINKNLDSDSCDLTELLSGNRALKVLNAVLDIPSAIASKPFLIMECIDPSHGELAERYTKESPVDYVMDVNPNAPSRMGGAELDYFINAAARTSGAMLALESHDSQRLPSLISELSAKMILCRIFRSDIEAVCLYQGQELGLKNPTERELPHSLMLRLDTRSAGWNAAGKSRGYIRAHTRANTRIAFPLDEYAYQEGDHDSCLNFVKREIKRWKTSNP